METHELLMTALRALGVYVLMLVVIRVLGKRTVGNFTAFDLLVALMLGEMVDEIIYGDISISQGLVAVGVVAAAQYANEWLGYWHNGIDVLLEGTPTVVVRNGALVQEGMRAERMSAREVLTELRVKGIEDIREVKQAMVEIDGAVSVLLEDWAQPVRKSDLGPGPQGEKDAG